MDTKKTLRYNWEFGRETVAIRVSLSEQWEFICRTLP